MLSQPEAAMVTCIWHPEPGRVFESVGEYREWLETNEEAPKERGDHETSPLVWTTSDGGDGDVRVIGGADKLREHFGRPPSRQNRKETR